MKRSPLNRPCTPQRGFCNLGVRCRGVGNTTPRVILLTRQTDPLNLVQEAGWAPGQVWTGAENLTPPLKPEFDPQAVSTVASHTD